MNDQHGVGHMRADTGKKPEGIVPSGRQGVAGHPS